MRVLMIGAGGVGDAAVKIAAERDFFERWVVADYSRERAGATVASVAGRRGDGESPFVAAQVDASDAAAVEALAREHGATHVFNAVDPRFVMPIFDGALAAGAWASRTWLGRPGIGEGDPADLLVTDDDPRTDLHTLRAPRVILRGSLRT